MSDQQSAPYCKGLYSRGTTEVERAVEILSAAGPEGIVMVGSYDMRGFYFSNQGVRLKTKFFGLSLMGTTAYLTEAREATEGVIISQVGESRVIS